MIMAGPDRDNNKSLLNIRTCNLYIICTMRLKKGFLNLVKKIEDLFINLYYYFNDYLSQKEDYCKNRKECFDTCIY